jgi:hypothetical protein
MQVKLLFVAVVCAGCSFPDVTFGGGPASGGGGDGNGAAPPEGGNGVGGSNGGSPPIGGAPACDTDMDGALVQATGCCTVPVDCDCDDTNPDVFPGQTDFFEVMRPEFSNPRAVGAFDYDCDGVDEEEFLEGNCIDLEACATATDDMVFQPESDYACGLPGFIRYCTPPTCQQMIDTLGCR